MATRPPNQRLVWWVDEDWFVLCCNFG